MSEPVRGSYIRLWTAVTLSKAGNGIIVVALPLLAASFTRDPIAISGLAVAAGLPWLVLGPLSGAIVDRYGRRQLIIAVDLARFAIVGVTASYVLAGGRSMFALYGVVLLVGGGETVVGTAAQAMLPAVIERSKIDRALGRLYSAQTVAQQLVGPLLGAFLFGLGVGIPLIVNAATFFASALLVTGIHNRDHVAGRGQGPAVSLRWETAEGLRWLWNNKTVRALAVGDAVRHFAVAAGASILVLMAQDELGLTSSGYAALLAAVSVGYVLGSGIAPRVAAVAPRSLVVVGSCLAAGVALGGVGLAPNWIVALFGLACVGVSAGLWNVIAASYRIAAVPDRLLGRIMAGNLFLAHGAVPIGALIGGASASVAGSRAAYLVGASSMLLLVPYLWRVLRNTELDPLKVMRERGFAQGTPD